MKKAISAKYLVSATVTPILAILAVVTAFTPFFYGANTRALNFNLEQGIVHSERLGFGPNERKLDRVAVLTNFFAKYNSPLKDNAKQFVAVADKYKIDYRLLPAIACMESSCGKFLIPNTYNPFGWGIYGKNYIAFKDYNEAIDTVGKGIKENYVSKGYDTPEEIAPIYTPPNHRNWLAGVSYFIDKMDETSEGMRI